MNKQERIQVFEETMLLCRENDRLREAVQKSIKGQEIIWEKDELPEPTVPDCGMPEILLSEKRTLEAAKRYAGLGKKVCALNFASYVEPGGGVARGASSQEESICRISSLYPAIANKTSAGEFYRKHWEKINQRKERGEKETFRRNSDDSIYTPGVVVLREDTHSCEWMAEADWFETDFITCAAPDLRRAWFDWDEEELRHLIDKRIRRIFQIAALHDEQVLILGAFGCGVFLNPPYLVAKAFEKVIEEMGPCFETIEFALNHHSAGSENYVAFSDIRNIRIV